jgi:hypothetical protein
VCAAALACSLRTSSPTTLTDCLTILSLRTPPAAPRRNAAGVLVASAVAAGTYAVPLLSPAPSLLWPQWLEPRLVLLRLDCFQTYKYTRAVDNRRLAEPRQPIYSFLYSCRYRLLPRFRLFYAR